MLLQVSCKQGSCVRFLGVNISNDLTWSAHTVVKAARKHLFFLRRLKKFAMDSTH